MTTDHDTDTTPRPDGPSFPRWLKWGLLGALAVLVVGYGVIFLYAKVLNDSPDELGEGDLSAALATVPDEAEPVEEPVGEPADEPAPATTVAPAAAEPAPATTAAEATEEPAPATTAAEAPGGPGGWVVNDQSVLGYRVQEVLFGVDTTAAGRTNQVTGAMTIEGTTVTAAEFVVDVASITSDESRRDNQFRGRIMSVDQFPEATFVLTEPIELGLEVAEGAEVVADATGELTLRGVTNTVTFEITARLENGQIGVLGSIPVLFSDYGIPNPSFGGISTEDNGLLEFVLVFEPA